MAVGALISAAIMGINALYQNDKSKRDHQEQINAGEQQLFDRRNAAIDRKKALAAGQDPDELDFANQVGSYRKAVSQTEAPQNWLPLVQSVAGIGNAAYNLGSQPSAPEAPSGRDVPGKNFSPAPNYAPAVNYSDWQPVAASGSSATEQPGGYIGGLAKKYEEADENSLPRWLR